MRVESSGGGIYLELSVKTGNGYYKMNDPVWVEAIIDTASKVFKRQLLVPAAQSDSRHIPQTIKTAVWQRDQGRCVQCHATSYLEFDHIIPLSKGGATSVNNLQLLCRRCNLLKGDRI